MIGTYNHDLGALEMLAGELRGLEELHRQSDEAGAWKQSEALQERMAAVACKLAAAAARLAGGGVVEFYGLDQGTSSLREAIAGATSSS